MKKEVETFKKTSKLNIPSSGDDYLKEGCLILIRYMFDDIRKNNYKLHSFSFVQEDFQEDDPLNVSKELRLTWEFEE